MSKLDEAAKGVTDFDLMTENEQQEFCNGVRYGFMKAIEIVRARYDRLKTSNIQEYESVESTLSELEIFTEDGWHEGMEHIKIRAVPIKDFAGEK